MSQGLTNIGGWSPTESHPAFNAAELVSAIQRVREPIHIVQNGQGFLGLGLQGNLSTTVGDYSLLASLPALYPEWLGDRAFLEAHGTRFPYVAGEMARGIASTQMVIAMGKANMMAFYGTAGLSLDVIDAGITEIESHLGTNCTFWGTNLIHDMNDPEIEGAVVNLFLKRNVTRVSASAFMSLTPHVVRYACHGLHQSADGQIQRKNYLFAKISRPEVATHFMSPPPKNMLDDLVNNGQLTRQEADLALQMPLSDDVTVESDSGGHTDNRPLLSLFPTIRELRDKLTAQYNYSHNIRLGAAGGLGTPDAVASAFALGASYVLVASVNQAAVESGLSEDGRNMMMKIEMADVAMAPCADMFELGVKVQVIKRGSMFANRASQLYEVYNSCKGLDDIPPAKKAMLEKQLFKSTLEATWENTRAFFMQHSPKEVERAEKDPKHLMALVFRWYLGKSSHWPISGESERRLDYQIWCGPAMGAFNTWVAGSFLEAPENRTVVQIAKNLLEGAAIVTRAQQLRSYGLPVPASAFHFTPRVLN
jgi:PfaD family protein